MFPYSCDARLYHLPYATGALIAVNVLAFFAHLSGRIDQADGWLLVYGDGLHPAQWLLSRFSHGSLGHLASNMFFLWTFGLVVEGKLGWQRFLACYLGIAVGQAAIEQAMFAAPGAMQYGEGSLGASAAIYGIMVMACLWAPLNQVSVLVIVIVFPFTFEMAVGYFAALFVVLDLLQWMASGGGPSSSLLHLMGGAMGAVVGWTMLKRGSVDCEDWDLPAVLSGSYGEQRRRAREDARRDDDAAVRPDQQQLESRRKFDAYLDIGQPEQALDVKRRAAALGRPLDLDRRNLLRLIAALQQQGKWRESAPVLAELIEVFPVGSQEARLKLAHICLVKLDRPARALELLAGLDAAMLPPQQETLRRNIVAAARKKVADGELEVDDNQW